MVEPFPLEELVGSDELEPNAASSLVNKTQRGMSPSLDPMKPVVAVTVAAGDFEKAAATSAFRTHDCHARKNRIGRPSGVKSTTVSPSTDLNSSA
ncbi:hypothetical protein NL676_018584 [Syzygium grande]|nr:hypothetical protein NL676_018584 [Syzygium grande]